MPGSINYATLMRDDAGKPSGGSNPDFWLGSPVPLGVRDRIEAVFGVLQHLPVRQAVAAISDNGRALACNRQLLELLGGDDPQALLGRSWPSVMPSWPDRVLAFRRRGERAFEDFLRKADGTQAWLRVSLAPITERGEERAVAYVLFVSAPDVETIDNDEVRRLRQHLELLAAAQTDPVAEVDRRGEILFVSPSFARAVGVPESAVVGSQLTTWIVEPDRADMVEALEKALKPPFCGVVTARMAAADAPDLLWQLDAVVGDDGVGVALVGRRTDERPAASCPPAPMEDPRLAAIRRRLDEVRPGDHESLTALARAVGEAAGAECVLYSVQSAEGTEAAVGWRLPPSV